MTLQRRCSHPAGVANTQQKCPLCNEYHSNGQANVRDWRAFDVAKQVSVHTSVTTNATTKCLLYIVILNGVFALLDH
jgi:hypothetical protein